MTSNFKAFLKSEVSPLETVEVKLDRFSEPIKLRPLSSAESDRISEQAFDKLPGKGGQITRVFNNVKNLRGMCVHSIIYPDLNDSGLQASYGVTGAIALYGELFSMGESQTIADKVAEISGITDINEDIEEAKN
ncbi:phage tail assembly chaperone [Psychrobacillus sp.]|uniref:phage tail assembly chaperone n=1 Tax=Psychrobacillus sp. TaxID=1871623 RepID=UPI0028BD3CC2|nr:phage portal protein [Psychrobacillus sp.]